MDIAIGMDVDGPLEKTLERAAGLRARGFTRMWSSQIFGPDTLTVFAVVGRENPDLDLGTAVVPIQTRHPTMLAAHHGEHGERVRSEDLRGPHSSEASRAQPGGTFERLLQWSVDVHSNGDVHQDLLARPISLRSC